MAKISNERTGEYLKTSLVVLKEKGGEYPSADLIDEMARHLNLSSYELSINNSGRWRWVTQFRFYSIGLVKAGWITKNGRTWNLTNDAPDFQLLAPIEIFDLSVNAYDKWNSNRSGNKTAIEEDIEENDEPEILMKVKPDDITFQEIINEVSLCKIQIPPFQRSFVWQPKEIRFLLDSIYRGYPIGSFIFWKTNRKLPRTRRIGNLEIERHISEGAEISYVIDGQQRITSLYAAVKGSAIDDEHFRFLFDLRGKKFIVSKTDDQDEAVLGSKDLENLQISIRTVFTESRASYNKIIRSYPEEHQSVLDNLYDRFVGYRFSVIQVIDQPADDEEGQSEGVRQVVRMFSRINETGRKLSVVAKMVARCWGEGFDLRESLDNFFEKNSELSSIRDETLLQAASVILNYKKARSRDILEKTNIRKLEAEWEKITTSFLISIDFVKTKIKIKNLKYLPFDAILVPLTYLFYKSPSLNFKQSQFVEKWFWRVSLSNRYDSTVETRIEEDCNIFEALLSGTEPSIDYLIDWASLKSRTIAQRYNLRNAFVKTILCLLSYAEPKNITDGMNVSLDNVFSGYYKHNMHHIFPSAYLQNNEPEKAEFFNSITNIMFIPAITNTEINKKAPSEYFTPLIKSNRELKDILKHHYIPDIGKSGLLEDHFTDLLDYRAEQMVQAFRSRAGLTAGTEKYFISEPEKLIDILENQIRTFIHEKLSDQTETSYWEDFIPVDIQQAVDSKIKNDLKRHPYNLEEYMRDEIRINYLDIMDYSKIIVTNWLIFKSYFLSKGEVEQRFRALKNYRNPIKHGRELTEIDRLNGQAAVLWIEKIIGQTDLLNIPQS